jgi:hypothetical protein
VTIREELTAIACGVAITWAAIILWSCVAP